MGSFERRVHKKLADDLQDGEEITAAVLAEPRGTYWLGMFPILAGLSRTVQGHHDRRAAEGRLRIGGEAARYPIGPTGLIATDRRVLVSESNGLAVSRPVLEYDLGQITVGAVRAMPLARRVQLVFWDGTDLEVDVQRGQPVDRLAEALAGP